MKKLAALAMVLTMAVTTLAGCSAAPAEETAASAAASQTEAAEETSVPAESSAPTEGTQAESEAAASDGTVYPILRKLKADGLVKTYLSEESGGPPRKYYSLTELGRKHFESERSEYLAFSQAVNDLLEDRKDD